MDDGTAAPGAGHPDGSGRDAATPPEPVPRNTFGPQSILLVTTVARAPHAVLTSRSLAAQHPEMPLTVVVVDDRFGEVTRATETEPGTWVPASSLLGSDVLNQLLAEHDVERVCTIVQPALVMRMLESTPADVVLLVADHLVLRRAIHAFLRTAASASAGFVAIRHAPPPVDGRLPDAAALAEHGLLQRCLAVFTRRGLPLVAEWANALRHHPLEGEGRFDRVAHHWFDDLALRAPHEVHVGDPDLVGSYRNLDELSRFNSIAALSFEGFDAERPWVLSTHAGEWPRVLLSAHHDLAEATDRYASEVMAVDTAMPRVIHPYATLANGHPYDQAMRSIFTSALHHCLRHGGDLPPNPFTDPKTFVDLLAEPAPERPGITRHLLALTRIRPDLGVTFADDDGAFRRWAVTDAPGSGIWTPVAMGSAESPTGEVAVPAHLNAAAIVAEADYGLNVVGLLSAQLGIGEQGRLALRAIAGSAIPYSVIDHDDTVHARDVSVIAGHPAEGFRYDIDVLLLNADQTRSALARLGREGRSARPTVGLWAWESPVFPERFHGAYRDVSEVWVATSYIKETLMPSATAAGVSVEVIPLQFPYVAPRGTHHDQAGLAALGVDPARPFFTFMFDYFSVAERKQPWAAVDAFRHAFPVPSPHGPQFVVKSLNHEFFPLERERLIRAVAGRSDIVLIEQYIAPALRTALVASAAAYVSLHRAEGLGLTMAEAMGASTPVIGTGWSGNTDFMTQANSWLVDYELVDIPRTVAHYGGAGQWAEPSIAQAAEHLRRIVDDPAEAQSRCAQAVADLVARNESGADAAFVVDRIRRLRARDTHRSRNSHDTAHSVPGGSQ